VVTGDTFLTMVEKTALRHVPVRTVFQLNGASAHFYRHVGAFLNREFSDRWIGRGGPMPWPPRSPDLTPFFCLLRKPVDIRIYHLRVEMIGSYLILWKCIYIYIYIMT